MKYYYNMKYRVVINSEKKLTLEPYRVALYSTNTPIIHAGFQNCLFLSTDDGVLKIVGLNTYGQIGVNNTTNYKTPVAVLGNHFFTKAVHSEQQRTYAIDNNGKAWCWGSNQNLALGDGTGTYRSTPVAVYGNHTFCALFGNQGSLGVMAIDNNGKTWAWGSNQYYGLGHYPTGVRSTPYAVYGTHTFCIINIGTTFGIGVDNNGKAWSWGRNSYGATGLNIGSFTFTSTPKAVCGNRTFCKLSGGNLHTIGIDVNGKTWGWGRAFYGSIGDGANNCRSTPVAVCGGHTFCYISCGVASSYAIDKDGKTWAWGWNNYGQLGTNNTSNYSIPVAVCGNHTFCEIRSGYAQVIAVDNNNFVWGWGYNNVGQLGLNDQICYSTPVLIRKV